MNIQVWLDNLSGNTPVRSKRARADSHLMQLRGNRRQRPLHNITDNIMRGSHKQSREPKSKQPSPPSTPRQKRASPQDEEASNTVRPTKRQLRAPSSLKSPAGQPLVVRALSSCSKQKDEEFTSVTTSDSAASRKSPTKTTAGMAHMAHPIEAMSMSHKARMPAELRKMVDQITLFAKGIGIVTQDLKDRVAACALIAPGPLLDIMASTERAQLGDSPDPTAFERILGRAEMLANNGHCEFAWNVDVHSRLLELALDSSPHASCMDYAVATSARIEPRELLPMDFGGLRAKSKMVDFVVHIKETSAMKQGIRGVAADRATAIDSFNQTLHDPLRYQPAAISIETKLPGAHWDAAQAQLSIWASAQYTKLELLLARAGTLQLGLAAIPPLPLIVIQGHEWKFLAVTRSDTVTTLWSQIPFGSTMTYEGLYSVIATLQYLFDWVQRVYWPWFKRYIMNILLA